MKKAHFGSCRSNFDCNRIDDVIVIEKCKLNKSNLLRIYSVNLLRICSEFTKYLIFFVISLLSVSSSGICATDKMHSQILLIFFPGQEVTREK